MVCRTCAYDRAHAKKMIGEALAHRGFSLVEVIAPCRTFGDQQKGIVDRLDDLQKKNHQVDDRESALCAASRVYDSDSDPNSIIPVGIVWKKAAPCFDDEAKRVREDGVRAGRSMDDILDGLRPDR